MIAEPGNIYQGQKGKIVQVDYGSRETDYTIQLDKESRGNQRVVVTVPMNSQITFLMKL